ncbi:MAG TPA: heme exporter protein CcmD [Rhizomicrobium sp.]|nr:heme exporter protein CcmD [Rhizomicrobium sp.]
MSDFLAMGGYGAYVWPAYAASVIGIGGAILLTVRAWRRAKARLAQLENDKP